MENPLDTQADAFDSAISTLGQTPLVAPPLSQPLSPPLAPQQALGHYLSSRREAMEMSIDQISRTTKIPNASLLHLEAGRFDKLPGDVFVRGFLRSYARCLKLDGDDVVSRYAHCGLNPAPVSSELAETVLARNTSSNEGRRPRRFPKSTQSPKASKAADNARPVAADDDSAVVQSRMAKSESVRNVLRDAFDLRNWQRWQPKAEQEAKCEDEASKPERIRTFVPPRLNYNDEMSHRGPLTLGVIILVIVATLTMSYLLRRPGQSVDGFTMAPAADESALSAEPTQNV
jgi:hypothetical protein